MTEETKVVPPEGLNIENVIRRNVDIAYQWESASGTLTGQQDQTEGEFHIKDATRRQYGIGGDVPEREAATLLFRGILDGLQEGEERDGFELAPVDIKQLSEDELVSALDFFFNQGAGVVTVRQNLASLAKARANRGPYDDVMIQRYSDAVVGSMMADKYADTNTNLERGKRKRRLMQKKLWSGEGYHSNAMLDDYTVSAARGEMRPLAERGDMLTQQFNLYRKAEKIQKEYGAISVDEVSGKVLPPVPAVPPPMPGVLPEPKPQSPLPGVMPKPKPQR